MKKFFHSKIFAWMYFSISISFLIFSVLFLCSVIVIKDTQVGKEIKHRLEIPVLAEQRKAQPLEELSLKEKVWLAEDLIGLEVNHIPGYITYKNNGADSLMKKSEVGTTASYELKVSDLVSKSGRDTIPGDSLKQIILKGYPKNWVEGEITKISQTFTESDAWAICSTDQSGFSEITFYAYSYSQNPYKNVEYTLSHEIAHANDWDNDNSLTFEERIDFLLKIIDRVQSKDRFMSSYVESITNPDPQHELKRKAKEYWGDICGVYFSGSTQRLNTKDIAIIEWVISLNDPNFDLLKACKVRSYSHFIHGTGLSYIEQVNYLLRKNEFILPKDRFISDMTNFN